MENGFEHYLATLGDSQLPLSVSNLTMLSDLNTSQIRQLQEIWMHLSRERRQRVVQELASLAEDNVDLDFNSVFKMALTDEDPQIRIAAIDGLWEDTERSLIDTLIKMSRTDPSTEVRAAAAGSLGRYVYQDEMGKLDRASSDKIRTTLLSLIHNPQEPVEVARRALEAISFLSGNEEVTRLIDRAYNSGTLKMRASAVFAMGRNCDERWLGIIINEMHSPSPEMRYEAARACGELEDKRAVSHLAPLIDDNDAEVRHAAVEALGHIGGNVARRILRKCLDSDDPEVEQLARQALHEIGLNENVM